ncbi:hypothetical protein EJ04DRAFT_496607 [Polyplosphaeria fusca]|uniref:DUF6590 domain-containing protein n=1 Tax=Polyplosphaeria fusca TaxID=682080 RepID=A0A9P4QX54_9PLEO|nr:hypothetical protein EJ04DRAFT_496607 [Polyplosphaeria fusca]
MREADSPKGPPGLAERDLATRSETNNYQYAPLDQASTEDIEIPSNRISDIRYSKWTWSGEHKRYYRASFDKNGNLLKYHWSKGDLKSEARLDYYRSQYKKSDPLFHHPNEYSSLTDSFDEGISTKHFSQAVQEAIGGANMRYRRVASHSYSEFFIRGRVFQTLWTEPVDRIVPMDTLGSAPFSSVNSGDTSYSRIRRFVVGSRSIDLVRPSSQCFSISTYQGRGMTKFGIFASDHAIIYTANTEDYLPPQPLEGEPKITKHPIRVVPSNDSTLALASRVNFGRTYHVECNVKLLEIGMVAPEHLHLINAHFLQARRS